MDTAQRQVWLDKARDGDTDALGALLESYRPYVAVITKGFVNELLCPSVGHSGLIQEAMLAACKDFRQFQGFTPQQFGAWFRKVAIHAAQRIVDGLFAGKRDPRRVLYSSSLLRRIAGVESSPSSVMAKLELSTRIAELMHQLSGDAKEIMWARHFEGLPFKEIAERLGKPLATVKSLYWRGVEEIREKLQQEGRG